VRCSGSAAAPREQAQQSDRRGAHGDERQLGLELGRDVRLLAQLRDRAGELLAFGLDLVVDLLLRALLGRTASLVSFASWIACSGSGGVAFLNSRLANSPSTPVSIAKTNVMISNASQVSTKIASTAVRVANRNVTMNKPLSTAPSASAAPTPNDAAFRFSSSCASSASSRPIAVACPATRLTAARNPPFRA